MGSQSREKKARRIQRIAEPFLIKYPDNLDPQDKALFALENEVILKVIETLMNNPSGLIPLARNLSGFLEVTLRAMDSMFAAKGFNPLACHKGCNWCCHLHVDINQAEAMSIAGYLKEMPEKRRQQILQKLEDTERIVAEITPKERRVAKIPCAFLGEDGACQIYPVRPLGCQNFHSMDATVCQISWEGGEDKLVVNEYRALLGGYVMGGFKKGLQAMGYDYSESELHRAVKNCMLIS